MWYQACKRAVREVDDTRDAEDQCPALTRNSVEPYESREEGTETSQEVGAVQARD
jgi:hypothetical protein